MGVCCGGSPTGKLVRCFGNRLSLGAVRGVSGFGLTRIGRRMPLPTSPRVGEDEPMDQPDAIQPDGPAVDWESEFKRLDAKGSRPVGAEPVTPMTEPDQPHPQPPPDGEPDVPACRLQWYGMGHQYASGMAGQASIEFAQMPPPATLIALVTALGPQLRPPPPGG